MTVVNGPRTRRTVALISVLLLMVAACSDDNGSQTAGTTATSAGAPTATTQPNDVDPNGVLRLPWDLQATPPGFDTANPTPPATPGAPQAMVYGTLMRPTDAYGVNEPGLAKSVDFVDSSTIHIELQDGVTFTDGTPFDAQAVKTGIEYNRDSNSTVLYAERKAIDQITVDNPLALTLHLSKPFAGELITRMAHGEFMIPSPKALADGVDLKTHPVGAGPFMLDSFQPGEKLTLVKNPNYFRANDIKVARVEFIQTTSGEAQITGLRSGAVDVGEQVLYPTATQLQGSNIQVDFETSENEVLWVQICKSRPPFDDVRVRQALNYGMDRDALNQAVYQGRGEPMGGFWLKNQPLHDPSLDSYYAYNPDRARQLLADAGQPNLKFDMYFTPGSSDRAAEVLQAQWAKIGVTVNIKPLTSAADFFPDAKGAPADFFVLAAAGIQRVARNLVPGSVGNVCTWNDPELNQAVDAVRGAERGSPAEAQAWKQVQERTYETAANIFGIFGVRAKVWNPDRLGNVSFMANSGGRPTINFYDVYVKK